MLKSTDSNNSPVDLVMTTSNGPAKAPAAPGSLADLISAASKIPKVTPKHDLLSAALASSVSANFAKPKPTHPQLPSLHQIKIPMTPPSTPSSGGGTPLSLALSREDSGASPKLSIPSPSAASANIKPTLASTPASAITIQQQLLQQQQQQQQLFAASNPYLAAAYQQQQRPPSTASSAVPNLANPYASAAAAQGYGMNLAGMLGAQQQQQQQSYNPQAAMMQGMLGHAGMRQGLDMNNPIIMQMMMQQFRQAMSMTNTPGGASQMAKLMGMYPGLANFMEMMKYYAAPPPPQSHMMGMQVNPLMLGQPTHDDDEEEENMGVAETFADYMPSKLKLGVRHPDPVVETASMSSVESPDVWYETNLPDEVIDTGNLSALQLESIVYASQQHEQFLADGNRAGFLIGDGAGVGKGRTIAGIIWENWLKGRKKALWISVSNDLKYDAERDLKDIGVKGIQVHFLSKMKYAKINSDINGNVRRGVIYATYSALIGESTASQGKYKTRMKQIMNWCGEGFDGCIIFDECHRAKNLCPVGSGKPTKTGMTVLDLQNKLPQARVVYASATGASEPKNMAYMVRTGIWGKSTPFKEFVDFVTAVEKRGVGAMEIVAMDMKLRGSYIARQLSFHGVSFRIEEVPLTKDFQKMYDTAVQLWVRALRSFTEASELIQCEKGSRKSMWGQFWSSHQRFFKYLCIGAKVNHAVRLAKDAIEANKCVVIGLQSTGEARTLEQLEREEGELSDFVSTAKGVLEALVEKHFPGPDRGGAEVRAAKAEESRNQKGKEAKEVADQAEKEKAEALAASGEPAPEEPTPEEPAPEEPAPEGDPSPEDIMSTAPTAEPIEIPGIRSSSRVAAKRLPLRQAAQRAAKRRYCDGMSEPESEDSDFETEIVKISDGSHSEFSGGSDYDDEGDFAWGGSKRKRKIKPVKTKKVPRKRENEIKLPPPPKEYVERATLLKADLMRRIELLGKELPPNTLDQLIDALGGSEKVAEMTGRKGRVVQLDNGSVQYESRSLNDVPLEVLNMKEKERFMGGEKHIAIISEAASSGISLQSDKRVANQRRRVHITLELPWSADRAIQQFGRTHRSNQVNAPEYIFLISELAGERRFASTVAKRLESLGALTHGDRRATESRDLSSFNIDNKYGRLALESTMKTMMGYEHPIVSPPGDYKGDFFADIQNALVGVGLICREESIYQLDKDYNNMSKFLNRILGMPVELQNRFFQYFTDTLAAIITQARKTGKYDLGILDLGIGGEGCKQVKTKSWVSKLAAGVAKTHLHTVLVERGMTWAYSMEKFDECEGEQEGYYLSHQVRNGKKTAILAVLEPSIENSKREKNRAMYIIYRPNTGMQMKQESFNELKKKYKKCGKPDEAEMQWEEQFKSSENTCSHAYWQGNCRKVSSGIECEIGRRCRTYNVLCGSVLNCWAIVEDVLNKGSHSHSSSKMQVVRLKTQDGKRLVGTLIPNPLVGRLASILQENCTESSEEIYDPPKDDSDIEEIVESDESDDENTGSDENSEGSDDEIDEDEPKPKKVVKKVVKKPRKKKKSKAIEIIDLDDGLEERLEERLDDPEEEGGELSNLPRRQYGRSTNKDAVKIDLTDEENIEKLSKMGLKINLKELIEKAKQSAEEDAKKKDQNGHSDEKPDVKSKSPKKNEAKIIASKSPESKNVDKKITNLNITIKKSNDLSYIDETNKDVKNIGLKNTEVKYIDVKDSGLRNIDLKSIDVKNSAIKNIDFKNTNLKYSDVKNTSYKSIDLKNADIKDIDVKNPEVKSFSIKSTESKRPGITIINLNSGKISNDLKNISGSNPVRKSDELETDDITKKDSPIKIDSNNIDISRIKDLGIKMSDLTKLDTRNIDIRSIYMNKSKVEDEQHFNSRIDETNHFSKVKNLEIKPAFSDEARYSNVKSNNVRQSITKTERVMPSLAEIDGIGSLRHITKINEVQPITKIPLPKQSNTKSEEPRPPKSRLDELLYFNSKIDEPRHPKSKLDELLNFNTKIDELRHSNIKIDEQRNFNIKINEPRHSNSKSDERRHSYTKIDEPRHSNARVIEGNHCHEKNNCINFSNNEVNTGNIKDNEMCITNNDVLIHNTNSNMTNNVAITHTNSTARDDGYNNDISNDGHITNSNAATFNTKSDCVTNSFNNKNESVTFNTKAENLTCSIKENPNSSVRQQIKIKVVSIRKSKE